MNHFCSGVPNIGLQNLQKDCQNLTLGTWENSTLCLNIVFFVLDYAEKNEGNSLVKYFYVKVEKTLKENGCKHIQWKLVICFQKFP